MNVAPPHETANQSGGESAKARLILENMREQRKIVSERFEAGRSVVSAVVPSSTPSDDPSPSAQKPTPSGRSKTQQDLLAERRERMSRRFQFNEESSETKSLSARTLSTVTSSDASSSAVVQQTTATTATSSPGRKDVMINRSIHVTKMSPLESPQSADGDVSTRGVFYREVVRSKTAAAAAVEAGSSPKQPPTLRDIREAFEGDLTVPDITLSSCSEDGSSSDHQPKEVAISTTSSSCSVPQDQSCTVENDNSSSMDIIPHSALHVVSSPRAKFSKPEHARPAKLMTLRDVEVSRELLPPEETLGVDAYLPQRSSDDAQYHALSSLHLSSLHASDVSSGDEAQNQIPRCPSSPTSSLSSGSAALSTKEQRRMYIESLYGDEENRKMRRPSTTSSTGLRRHERNYINQVMVRGRVGVVTDTQQKVFVPSGDAAPRTERVKKEEPRCRGTSRVKVPSSSAALQTVQTDIKEGSPTRDVENATEALSTTTELDGMGESSTSPAVANKPLHAWKTDRMESVKLEACAEIVTSNDIEQDVCSAPRDGVLSLAEERRALLDRFKDDIGKPETKQTKPIMVTPQRSVSPSPSLSSTEEIVLSDDSSCDYTTSSDTTGLASSACYSKGFRAGCDSVTSSDMQSIVSAMTMPPMSPILPQRVKESLTNRIVTFAGEVSVVEIPNNESMADDSVLEEEEDSLPQLNEMEKVLGFSHQKRLFVTGRAADALCRASGGHFCLATGSDSDFWNGTTPLQPLDVTYAAPTVVRLSTDLRCGTRGSLYDVAVRSGCKIDKKLPSKSRSSSRKGKGTKKKIRSAKKQCPVVPEHIEHNMHVHGGIYEIAMGSGLTKENMHSRTPFSVTTKTGLSKDRSINGKVIPEEISDLQCGAYGSLSMVGGYLPTSFPTTYPESKKPLFAIEEITGTSPELMW